MSGLNVSIAFFLLVVSTCEMLRRLSKRLLSPGAYCCLAGEMLLEIGPWGGGFGPDVVFTLLFLLFMVHAASLDGASANPTVSLQEFLLLESGPAATAAKLLAQAVGVGTGWAITKLYWSWELTQFHLIQNLIASECSSSIRTSLYHGAFVEGACSFFFHLVLLRLRRSRTVYRAPALAATVTFLTYAGEQRQQFRAPKQWVKSCGTTSRCTGWGPSQVRCPGGSGCFFTSAARQKCWVQPQLLPAKG
uniref:Uncharacterized protein n=1 Tax=Anas platyrhynchos platyrhynchos TaxID=8840 RepID=A0A493T021_ANAPP